MKQLRISDQLKVSIESSGMTCAEIARRTGIHRSILSRFMHGESNMDGGNIDRIGELLGLELATKGKARSMPMMSNHPVEPNHWPNRRVATTAAER